MKIGRFIHQYRWLVVFIWLIAAALLAGLIPKPDATVGETSDLLPANTPVHIALDELGKHFGDKSALSEAVIVFERQAAVLTAKDLDDIEQIGQRLHQSLPDEQIAEELSSLSIRTPATLAMAGEGNPLISVDRHAALITISLPYNFITKHAARVVKHAQAVVEAFQLQSGLSAAVTGSAGYGYDYAVATERSHHKTLLVTLISVICILLMVYRAPVAAMIPMVGISLAALIVLQLMSLGEKHGFHSGTAEQIFTFVLLYGAGVDYSLLFMSRYREFLDEGKSSAESIVSGLNASFIAVASSAVMTVSGLFMLCFARFSIFRHAGPAIVLALIVAALAATTLVPAMLAIIGSRAFWPGRRPNAPPAPVSRFGFWPAIAGLVVRRPRLVLTVTLAILLVPSVRGLRIDWNYDAMFSLKPTYHARRGTEMVQRHWPIGETAPVTILAVSDQPQPAATWLAASTRIAANLSAIEDVDNVRSLAAPLGLHASQAANLGVMLIGHDKVAAEFQSADGQAMRMKVVLKLPPLGRPAMDDVSRIAAAARNALDQGHLKATIHLSGATAEMMDIRAVTQEDFKRIATLSLAAILLIVVAVLRDVLLSLFILAATLLSYLATLGLTTWIFGLLGSDGLEWKVQMLLFIVLVAVGQDYSIFFAVRYAQEASRLPCAQATERALIFTGPVISSCGLIMAATLGSVMAGDVKLLVQLGFAFALGMLMDTFIVRPLLLPAFIVITRRTLHRAAAFVG